MSHVRLSEIPEHSDAIDGEWDKYSNTPCDSSHGSIIWIRAIGRFLKLKVMVYTIGESF